MGKGRGGQGKGGEGRGGPYHFQKRSGAFDTSTRTSARRPCDVVKRTSTLDNFGMVEQVPLTSEFCRVSSAVLAGLTNMTDRQADKIYAANRRFIEMKSRKISVLCYGSATACKPRNCMHILDTVS